MCVCVFVRACAYVFFWQRDSHVERACHQGAGMYVNLAHVRARRWHAQTTHVFALCDASEDHVEDVQGATCRLDFRAEPHDTFSFLTPWSIARELLETTGCEEFILDYCRCEVVEDYLYFVKVKVDVSQAEQIWPALPRPRAPPPAPPAVDLAEAMLNASEPRQAARRPQPKMNSLGVRPHLPAAILVVAPPVPRTVQVEEETEDEAGGPDGEPPDRPTLEARRVAERAF
jgi:hypothetical protein